MSAKVSPEGKPSAPVNLYDDAEDEERVPPVTADANGAAFNTSAAAMRSRTPEIQIETVIDKNDSEQLDVSGVGDNDRPETADSSKKKLGFKAAAEKVRRNSTDSIGNTDDLLHPNSAANKDGEDVPDFWDKISQFSVRMRKDARYFFQHPYARLLVAYLVTFCNFLIYAEDPVAHSSGECNIPVVGNIFSFVATKYPPNHGWRFLKVLLWLTAIACGLVVGKLIIHRLLLKRLCKLQMFQEDMGSFMIMFLTTLLFLFIFSWLYNAFLLLGGPELEPYAINGYMRMRNSTFMKAAACGTWLGDFFTAWMVTDVMLQEKFYPEWARPVRRWWNRGKNRIILFWCMALIATIIVVTVIATDEIKWDYFNSSFLATNELSRAFLASFILVMDLLIVMQDWDFPHFINHFDIKLPGLNTADLKINIPQCLKRFDKITIHITGKWFNYGIIFLVMLLDLNMWKNQIFYNPSDYAQYYDNTTGFIYSYRSDEIYLLAEGGNLTNSNHTLFGNDVKMESKFLNFPLGVKAIAFIPSLAAFVAFIVTIIIYGRVKPTKADPYGGRIVKYPKSQKKLSMFAIVKMKFMRRKTPLENEDMDVVDGRYRASTAEAEEGVALKETNKDEDTNKNAQFSSNNSITI